MRHTVLTLGSIHILLACLAMPARAQPQSFWVGGGGAPCQFSTLSTAIGAVPDGAIIRIASNQTYDDINVTIIDKPLILEGGWADCAGTPAIDNTVLNGSPVADMPVIRAESNGSLRQVRLSRLDIRGGTRSGIEGEGMLDLRLEDVVISDSTAADGGGLNFFGTSPEEASVRLRNTRIGSSIGGDVPGNIASLQGGGIACTYGRMTLDAVVVQDNQSNYGGGIFLNNCIVTLGSQRVETSEFGPVNLLIADNAASFFGGGLYAIAGSQIEFLPPLAGADPSAVRIHGNSASRGGGMYLSHDGTWLDGEGVNVTGNTATTFGGGVWVSGLATLSLSRGEDSSATCPAGTICSRISDNQVTSTNTSAGSAIQVANASLSLEQTEIAGNRSASTNQATVYIDGGGAAHLANSLIRANDDPGSLIRLREDHTSLDVHLSTLADNVIGASLIRSDSDTEGSNVNISYSVIWQPDSTILDLDPNDALDTDCMNAHEASSFPADTHDPGFVDAAGGNYRMLAASPNIDACKTSVLPTLNRDIAGQLRPFNFPTMLAGERGLVFLFDRGAYELGDLIFSDGFE